ncbi:hypothetical protein ACI79J_06015 [Geodermatophilus sp. SYSU D01062]
MTPTRALPVLLTAGALVLGGCTAAPDDTAAAAAPAAFDEVLGTVDLTDVAGEPAAEEHRVAVLDVEALDDGRALVLLAGRDTRLVEVRPGDDAPEVGDVVELPALGRRSAVYALPDGGVLVVGSDDRGPALLTVRDGEVTEQRLGRGGTVGSSLLSADGATLWIGLGAREAPDDVRLLAVDVATGRVTRGVPLGATFGPAAWPQELLARPDGGVVAVVWDPSRDAAPHWVARFDARLAPAGEPFGIHEGTEEEVVREASVGVLPDGAVVVVSQYRDGSRSSVVRDGVLDTKAGVDLIGEVPVVQAGPVAGTVTLLLAGSRPAVVTLDPVTGDVEEDLVLCEELALFADLGLSPDGTRGAAAGTCGDTEVVAVLVG